MSILLILTPATLVAALIERPRRRKPHIDRYPRRTKDCWVW